MSDWGILPEAVIAQIKRREWLNITHLRGRLSGSRPFPLSMTLKAPSGTQALADLEHFSHFLNSWKNWPWKQQVKWQQKKYQRLGEQRVPVALQLGSMAELIALLGPEAKARSRRWEQLMRPLLNLDERLSEVLLQHLSAVEDMSIADAALLAELLPQLQQGMGKGGYLRALPLKGVDTKFVENNQALITDLLDRQNEAAVSRQGGLLPWLDCRSGPGGWLLIRPLCRQSRKQLADLSILQLDSQTLLQYPLPAARILIVENRQSGYALPQLDNTIAVFGGGRNTAWMQADWLQQKHIAYWGDIDTWGLAILSDARMRQPQLQALMMDQETLLRHQPRMVAEQEPCRQLPEHLNVAELQLFQRLRENYYGKTRLEQERLAPDYVLLKLRQWWQTTGSEQHQIS